MVARYQDYGTLKRLLEEQETFPLRFVHKFIGRNTPRFQAGVAEFERSYPAAHRESRRLSGGAGAHCALTYVYMAPSADDVIRLLHSTAQIEDVLVIL